MRWEWFPPLKRLLALRDEVDEILFDEIAARRAAPDVGERTDILSLIVAEGEAEDQELRDELMTLLAAGHETTATALAWAFERLARHPHVVERIRAEEGEEYLDAVVKETLRIRPVITDVIRKLKEPMRLGEWEIPVDRHPTPAIALVQRDGAIYDDRLEFKPERFIGNPKAFCRLDPVRRRPPPLRRLAHGAARDEGRDQGRARARRPGGAEPARTSAPASTTSRSSRRAARY